MKASKNHKASGVPDLRQLPLQIPNSKFQVSAFSLLELLVVIAIIAILTALVLPSMRGIGGANQLTNASARIVSEINLARQTALAENQEIEVRFYKLPDATGQDPAYRALQPYRVSDGTPLGKIVRLPSELVLTDLQKFSTLLSSSNGGAPKTQTIQGVPNVEYRFIRFHASGATSLDPRGANAGADRWFFSLASQNDLRSSTGSSAKPANNFVTIQIDPVTGRLRVFQP